MEEKICEMEYTFNGEKYLITCTKINDDLETEITTTCDSEHCNDLLDSSIEVYETEDSPLVFSCKDIPDGIDVSTWIEILEKYGLILTK